MLAGIELAISATFQHDFAAAERLCVEARAVGEEHGELWAQAYAIYGLALCAWVSGDFARADRLGRECLRIKRTFHDLLGIVLAIEVLAWIAASQGNAARAATLLGATNEIWQSVGYPMFGSRYFGAPHGECEIAAVAALGEADFRVEFRRGMDLELEDAISFAIGEDTVDEPEPMACGHPADPARTAGGRPDRRWDVEQGDRRPPGDRPADRRGPRRTHPAEARLHLTRADRHLGHRTPLTSRRRSRRWTGGRRAVASSFTFARTLAGSTRLTS